MTNIRAKIGRRIIGKKISEKNIINNIIYQVKILNKQVTENRLKNRVIDGMFAVELKLFKIISNG